MPDASDPRGYILGHKAVSVSLSLEEFDALQELHRRCRVLNDKANKSTPFRAGLRYLMSLDDEELERLLAATPAIPRGPQRR